jgi:hypothetical protein
MMRLPGHVLPALARAKLIVPTSEHAKVEQASQPLTLTIVFRRSDETGFRRYLRDVYDSHSPEFHHFLNPQHVSDRFGPSREDYQVVLNYLRRNGFRLIETSTNRLTLTVAGTRAQAEQAFTVRLRDFAERDRRFFANDTDPIVPSVVARHIEAVAGLTNLSMPQPSQGFLPAALVMLFDVSELEVYKALAQRFGNAIFIEDIGWVELWDLEYAMAWRAAVNEELARLAINAGLGAAIVHSSRLDDSSPQLDHLAAVSPAGSGQKIGLLGFSSFRMSDVADWLVLVGLPADLINQVSEVRVAGGRRWELVNPTSSSASKPF